MGIYIALTLNLLLLFIYTGWYSFLKKISFKLFQWKIAGLLDLTVVFLTAWFLHGFWPESYEWFGLILTLLWLEMYSTIRNYRKRVLEDDMTRFQVGSALSTSYKAGRKDALFGKGKLGQKRGKKFKSINPRKRHKR